MNSNLKNLFFARRKRQIQCPYTSIYPRPQEVYESRTSCNENSCPHRNSKNETDQSSNKKLQNNASAEMSLQEPIIVKITPQMLKEGMLKPTYINSGHIDPKYGVQIEMVIRPIPMLENQQSSDTQQQSQNKSASSTEEPSNGIKESSSKEFDENTAGENWADNAGNRIDQPSFDTLQQRQKESASSTEEPRNGIKQTSSKEFDENRAEENWVDNAGNRIDQPSSDTQQQRQKESASSTEETSKGIKQTSSKEFDENKAEENLIDNDGNRIDQPSSDTQQQRRKESASSSEESGNGIKQNSLDEINENKAGRNWAVNAGNRMNQPSSDRHQQSPTESNSSIEETNNGIKQASSKELDENREEENWIDNEGNPIRQPSSDTQQQMRKESASTSEESGNEIKQDPSNEFDESDETDEDDVIEYWEKIKPARFSIYEY